jgi:hypothetical protein
MITGRPSYSKFLPGYCLYDLMLDQHSPYGPYNRVMLNAAWAREWDPTSLWSDTPVHHDALFMGDERFYI